MLWNTVEMFFCHKYVKCYRRNKIGIKIDLQAYEFSCFESHSRFKFDISQVYTKHFIVMKR